MEGLMVEGLTKRYPRFELQDISFHLPAGYIMGYVGRNGAGKTTTLNAVTHLIHADTGNITVNGRSYEDDPLGYLNAIGYIGDASYYPGDFLLEDIRRIQKNFYPGFSPEKFDEYICRWELPKKEKIGKYSRGMKVKLMFASILSRDTSLLILDEATNGLDPIMREEILELLQDYITDGKRSVLFSTHIMEDLAGIADYIFLIENGKKVLFETKDDLLEQYLLVRGGIDELSGDLETVLIGPDKKEFGFEGLISAERKEEVPSGMMLQRPTIDQIVLHKIKEMRK